MPDIAMCTNEGCPLKQKCFRYTAKPSEHRQSYSMFEPTIEGGKILCEWFWNDKNMKQPKAK